MLFVLLFTAINWNERLMQCVIEPSDIHIVASIHFTYLFLAAVSSLTQIVHVFVCRVDLQPFQIFNKLYAVSFETFESYHEIMRIEWVLMQKKNMRRNEEREKKKHASDSCVAWWLEPRHNFNRLITHKQNTKRSKSGSSVKFS